MKNIYDVCMFFNENDLLEIRLNEHDDFVEKFIIIESLQTHSGNSKRQNFDFNRFKKFEDKIEYVLLESLDETVEKFPELLKNNTIGSRHGRSQDQNLCWARENVQTNYCIKILEKLLVEDDAQVLWGGLDEILNKDVVLSTDKPFPHNAMSFKLDTFIYKLNIKFKPINGPLISSFLNYRNYLPSDLREDCVGFENTVQNAGWHFTGLSKDCSNIRDKYMSFSHSKDTYWKGIENLNDEELLDKVIASYLPDFKDNPKKYIVDIDNTYPEFVVQNKNRLSEYIYGGVY